MMQAVACLIEGQVAGVRIDTNYDGVGNTLVDNSCGFWV